MASVDTANPPQEYPDIIGARPTNPLAANFRPFIPPAARLPELTLPHLLTGALLESIFGASSLYLVLKVIAIVLEMSGIPSLAFAVGVYLPLASSSPIFVGGMVRWLVD